MVAKKKSASASAEDVLKDLTGKVEADELSYSPVTGEGDFLTPKFFVRTGISTLDAILGGDGMGTGRISEIYGPNKTAKSELFFGMLESFLIDHEDGIAIIFDQEYAMDPKKINDSPVLMNSGDRWKILIVPTLERLLGKILKMLMNIHQQKLTRPILIGVDSLKAIETEEEAKTKLEKEGRMSPQARVLSKALPKLAPLIAKTNCHLCLINQIRKRPGQPAFLDDESPGGEALKFYASYRLKTKQAGQFSLVKGPRGSEQGVPPSGLTIGVKTVKNKLATPDRSVEIPLLYNSHGGRRSGLSDAWSIFYTLKGDKKTPEARKFIKSKAGKFYIGDEKFDRREWYTILKTMGFGPETTLKQRMELQNPLADVFREWSKWVMDPMISMDLGNDGDDEDAIIAEIEQSLE